jgi:hypothetical protein
MLRLTEEEARARLEEMLQIDAEPTLGLSSVDDLLEFAKRVDSNRLAPGDTDWEPTWDLNAAAAEGWRRKAGAVAGRFNVTVDGDALSRAQAFGHCLQMAERYANRVAGTVQLGFSTEEVVDVIGN